MVYTAESIALAVLENLVHMSPADFPARYVALTVLVPDSVRVVDVSAFRRVLEPDTNAGDRWIETRESAVLRVRSIVVPGESLYLVNPAHRDFDRIRIELIEPFEFDPRLL